MLHRRRCILSSDLVFIRSLNSVMHLFFQIIECISFSSLQCSGIGKSIRPVKIPLYQSPKVFLDIFCNLRGQGLLSVSNTA